MKIEVKTTNKLQLDSDYYSLEQPLDLSTIQNVAEPPKKIKIAANNATTINPIKVICTTNSHDIVKSTCSNTSYHSKTSNVLDAFVNVLIRGDCSSSIISAYQY